MMMEKATMYFLILTSIHFSSYAQDTVYVNTQKNSYLVFDDDVSIVDLGTTGDFLSSVEKNVVFVKSLKDEDTETSIFVSAGNKVYAGILKFKTNNRKFLYDLRDRTLNVAASYSSDNYVPEIDIDIINERLFSLDEKPRGIHDVGVSKNKVDWSLTNVMVDNSAIYLKIQLQNNSALAYRVESLSVENLEFYKKRLLSKKKVNKIPVKPLIEGNVVDVKPYGNQFFYLALPLYAVGDQGTVLVTIREKSGVRSLQFQVPSQLMSKSDLF